MGQYFIGGDQRLSDLYNWDTLITSLFLRAYRLPRPETGQSLARDSLLTTGGCHDGQAPLDHATLGESTAAVDEEPAAANGSTKPSPRGASSRGLRPSRSGTRTRPAH